MQKSDWKKCKLGDVAEITSSKRIFLADYVKEGVPFYRSKEIIERSSGRSITTPLFISEEKYEQIINKYGAPIAGDLLLTSVGTLGIPYRVSPTDKFYFKDGNLTWFRKLNNILCDYLYYFFLSPIGKEKLALIAIGSTQKALTINALQGVTLSLPPLDEQKRIADILGAFDDKIELLQKQNKTLEDMAKALFKSWFVDFDVVRAKQKGLPKADIMREYHLTDELYDLFPSSFADSPLDPIPSGWEVKPLSKIAVLTMGQSPAGTTYNETGEGLPFYQGRTDFGFRFPKKRIYCSAPTRIAQKGDILISVRAPVGDLNMANETCCIGRGVASIRSNISKDSFLYYAMLSAQTQFDVFNTEGTVFGSINRKDLSSFSILTPIEQLVKEFNNIIGNFDLKIEENLKQIQTLTELRDTLLPRLISGKIRV